MTRRMLWSALLVAAALMSNAASTMSAALAQDAPAPGSLQAMLQQTPLVTLGGDSFGAVSYANLALQAETAGVAAPATGRDDPAAGAWLTSLGALNIHSRASSLISPDWRESFGFDLFDLDQVVEYSAPPASFSLFRGRFAMDDLVRQWVATGYQARTTDAGAYYTLGGDFELDLQSVPGRLALASANYAAVLAPDTIAFAATERLITEAVALAAGTGPSFAAEINAASLLAGAPADLASGLIISGTGLAALGDPAASLTGGEPADIDAISTRLAAEAAAAAPMPPITMALLGSTAGGPVRSGAAVPDARAVAVAVTTNDAAAATMAEVIAARLAGNGAGPVWADFFPAWEITVVADEPVVVVELELAPARPASILIQMLYRRELGLLTWTP